MSTSTGTRGLLWLWATVADLGSGGEPERSAQGAAKDHRPASLIADDHRPASLITDTFRAQIPRVFMTRDVALVEQSYRV